MDKIVDHLFVFRGEGKIEDFPGNYTDFRAYEDTPSFTNETPDKKPKTDWKNKEENKPTYETQRALNKLETKIAKLETQKKSLQNQFAKEALSPEEIKTLSIELKSVEEALGAETDAWLALSIEIE